MANNIYGSDSRNSGGVPFLTIANAINFGAVIVIINYYFY